MTIASGTASVASAIRAPSARAGNVYRDDWLAALMRSSGRWPGAPRACRDRRALRIGSHLIGEVLVAIQVLAATASWTVSPAIVLRREEGGDHFGLVERQRVRWRRLRCFIAVSFLRTKRNEAQRGCISAPGFSVPFRGVCPRFVSGRCRIGLVFGQI